MTGAERGPRAAGRRDPTLVTWHDVENGAYDADLPLWCELAAAFGGPVLDLGAGTGRVARHLSAAGHEVTALDSDAGLLAALSDRDPAVTTVTGDARDFQLDATFGLVIAPMQLMQILGGRDGRLAALDRAREHLAPGGCFAAAIADPYEALPAEHASGGDGATASPPLPDMLERDGWVFSSQPVSVREQNGCVVVTRRRQAVSPDGRLDEEVVRITLDVVGSNEFEQELRGAGFTALERREIPETDDHIGSTVIACRL